MWSRPRLHLTVLFPAVLVSSACGQEILKPVRTAPFDLAQEPSRNTIRAFFSDNSRLVAFVLGAGQAPESWAGARIVAQTGNQRSIFPVSYNGQAMAVGGDWAFLAPSTRGGRGVLIRASSGESAPIDAQFVLSAAFDPDGTRVAILGTIPGGLATHSRVSIFDCNSQRLLAREDLPVPAGRAAVSFDGSPDQVLLIDRTEFQVTLLKVGDTGVTRRSALVLTGPEVDDSLQRGARFTTTGNGWPLHLLAYFPGTEGRQLYLIGPYRSQNGATLVEFSPQGRQLRSFRLQAEEPSRTATVLRGGAFWLAGSGDTFDLLGQDGMIRTWVKPR